jgi:hypothetical protein
VRDVASWLQRPRAWTELFALLNLAGLAPDIYLAHSVNRFHARAEYIPLVFSLVSPLLLVPAVWALARGRDRLWRRLGSVVGWCAIAIGIAGLIWHLDSQFFERRTLASLVYTAPFAAPLAYTGLGLLLLLNRLVDDAGPDWARWVVFLALGGFVGNFVFSLADHAQNGFFHATEWVPVIASAIAIGFLLVPLLRVADESFLRFTVAVMAVEAVVGMLGFVLHAAADVRGVGSSLVERIVYGAPVFAPLLFPDLALLAVIGLLVLRRSGPPKVRLGGA